MTIIDNHTNDWKTVTSSDTVTTPQDQSPSQAQPQNQSLNQQAVHPSRRPTDRLEEFFYEQAKFFRHLERKYERFNQNSREDEQYARAGKFRHRPKPTPEQIQQRQQQQQQQGKPVVYGPYTLKQQQALDQRRAQRQASNQQQGQASGSNQKESARNSKGEILKGK
jgi:hypothetical protein